jgi:hypothetical protein
LGSVDGESIVVVVGLLPPRLQVARRPEVDLADRSGPSLRSLPVDSSKEQILERYWGGQSSARIVLVDDSITRDPAWRVTSSEAVPGLTLVDLPHEHGGLDGAHMRQILELIERL